MNAGYGELIGAYFDGHPWHQKIKLKVEDPKHAAGKSFKDGDEITDEIYQFKPQPYSREKLHIIMSVDNSSIDVKKGKRPDNGPCRGVVPGNRQGPNLLHVAGTSPGCLERQAVSRTPHEWFEVDGSHSGGRRHTKDGKAK